jgi:hypothetical protein
MSSTSFDSNAREAGIADEVRDASPALILHELLGQGGSAVVYRAFDARLDRSVALKLLPPAAALDAQCLVRFRQEIRIAAALDHPHIVPVYATGATDDAPYLEMQAIRGRSLGQLLTDLQTLARAGQRLTGPTLLELVESGYVSPPDAGVAQERPPPVRATPCYYLQIARWLAALASAFDHVHSRGFLHGDVKPANLLVEPSGQIWLIDFGTACELAAPPSGAGLVAAGTLPYLAPERLDGDAAPDVRQDVYGLGATLYELLTLRRPVAGQTAQTVMRELATRLPLAPRKLAPTTPRRLEAIAMRCLARRPEDRFATMGEVEQVLLECVESVQDQATRMASRPHVQRGFIAAAALLVLMMIGVVMYGAWPRTPSLADRAANLVTRLPAGLQAQLPSEQSPRLILSGVLQLGSEPFEVPLDLTTKDKLTWRIEPRLLLTHVGHSYTITPHHSSWLAAEALAQSWGGHLVAINDQAEQDFLNRTLLAQDPNGKYPVRWIGLSAADMRAEYLWSSGESVSFRNWFSSEPSRGWDIERCVVANWHLDRSFESSRVGEWNDVPEQGSRKTGGYQGIVELPHTQPLVPPVLAIRKPGGARVPLPAAGTQLPTAGRLVIEPAGDARQLIEVMITVE